MAHITPSGFVRHDAFEVLLTGGTNFDAPSLDKWHLQTLHTDGLWPMMFHSREEASMPRLSALTVPLGVALFLCWPALPNGGKAKKNILEARVTAGEGRYVFATEFVPIQYRMNTVRNKYKMLQIRINNDGAKPLALSRTSDKVEVRLRGNYVPAILDVPSVDPAFWDSLDASLRNELAYPPSVDRGEEESVFVFLPRTETDDVPDGIRYSIAGQPAPVVMRTPSIAKK